MLTQVKQDDTLIAWVNFDPLPVVGSKIHFKSGDDWEVVCLVNVCTPSPSGNAGVFTHAIEVQVKPWEMEEEESNEDETSGDAE